jgi:sialic acid synthase SpsE
MIIAEIGLNHGGSFNKAIEMIRLAKESGATVAKFQFYYTDILCSNRNCFNSYKLLEKIKMHPSWISLLFDECQNNNIEFLCTSFCKNSADAISQYVKQFKIASPEVCDLEFIKYVSEYGKPLILSTGKCNYAQLDKIFDSVTVPITLLYCKSLYPALPSDYNLSEIKNLKKRYKCNVGISDHTKGIKLAIEAFENEASTIEKHFMIGKGCIDEIVSLMPAEFKKMTEAIWKKKE